MFSEETRASAEAHPENAKRLDDNCSICVFIKENGWHGLDSATHCRNCHAVFGGNSIHCVVCHRTFSTPNTLDKHKKGIACLDPNTLERNDKKVFGEPRPNKFGTPIFRLAADDSHQYIRPLG